MAQRIKFLRKDVKQDGRTILNGAKLFPRRVPAIVSKAVEQELVGKAVMFSAEGTRVAGKVISVENGQARVKLAVPSRTGLLMVSDSEVTVKVADLEPTAALMESRKISAFETGMKLDLAQDKKFSTIFKQDKDGKDTGVIADYRDVVIEGYASTWGSPKNKDRGGDYISPTAFNATIQQFMTNPVILSNHVNTTDSLAGSWEKVGVTTAGLAVRGNISNAPGMQDTRFKLVEGHLKGLSIGGIWYYSQEEQGLIEEADLFEISLVAVPMNPEALAFTRSLGVAECRKAFNIFWSKSTALRSE
jgi:HK97 family phage prohead protease